MDDFLFAVVGEQGNGVGMTVVSLLARLGVDPWEEARRLSELSRPAAAHRLAPMIGRVPGRAWPPDAAQSIAERLVALLPDPQGIAASVVAPDATARPRPVAAWLICLVLLSALLLAMSMRPDLSPSRLLFGVATAPSSPR
jgi:hypothetical protein